jgi:cytochrome P450
MSGSYTDDEMFSKPNTFSARYWDDPHTFNPSRFLKDWPRDAFMPFSAGEK